LAAALSFVALLAGCVSEARNPTVEVMPRADRPMDIFAADRVQCRQYAEAQVSAPSTQQAATAPSLQQRYNGAYLQCMASRGYQGTGAVSPAPGPFGTPPLR
jgi:hypothetical protein